jgi:ribosome-associated protein
VDIRIKEVSISMLQINSGLFLADNELIYTFVRASGPGGQNINKVATAAQLRFDVHNSPSLTGDVKSRLTSLAGSKMTQAGVLVIEAKRYRSQEKNRSDAERRLVVLIQKALDKPKRRWPTKPSLASQARRVKSKKRKGITKRLRQSTED